MLYRHLADHYLQAIQTGTLRVGDRLPSLRALMQRHGVSLSTALQACRCLEDQGWVQARARSGYFVCANTRWHAQRPVSTADRPSVGFNPASYVGISTLISEILVRGQSARIQTNLALALGAVQLYPAAALQRIMQRVLRQDPSLLGSMARRHGHPALKASLARRALTRGITVAADEVVLTFGCIEAVNIALRAVTQPGDVVAVESPTFYGLLQVLESLGLKALEIPAHPQTGLAVDILAFAWQTTPVKAVLCMPNMQNPLGSVMPDEHKIQLLRLCQAHDVALIEDDIYGAWGRPGTACAKAIKHWDHSGQVIYCNSIGKSLAPGLRLGWMLPGRWRDRVEMIKYTQSRYNEELSQRAVAEFMDSAAYERHMTRFREALKQQRSHMAQAVARYFPSGTQVSDPAGGLVLWVQLPDGVSSQAVFTRALAQGIKLAPGLMFSNSARFDGFVRLSCGAPHTPQIEQAVERVGGIVKSLMGEGGGGLMRHHGWTGQSLSS